MTRTCPVQPVGIQWRLSVQIWAGRGGQINELLYKMGMSASVSFSILQTQVALMEEQMGIRCCLIIFSPVIDCGPVRINGAP